jgi:hypothetical protein
MIWILLIYVIGALIDYQLVSIMLANDPFDNGDPWNALMWPILLIALVADWIRRN